MSENWLDIAHGSPRCPTVVVVLGGSRSGTTAVGLELSRHLACPLIGESVHTWSRISAVELCSCGLSDRDCSVWSSLTWQLRRNPHTTRIVAEAIRPVERVRPWALSRRSHPASTTDAVRHMFETLNERLGRPGLLVDTSKRPGYVSVLRAAGIRVLPVWVIREPIAVVRAEMDVKPNPSISDPDRQMGGRSLPRALFAWLSHNSQAAVVTLAGRGPVVRFGNLVQGRVDLECSAMQDLPVSEGRAEVHALHGNPRSLGKTLR